METFGVDFIGTKQPETYDAEAHCCATSTMAISSSSTKVTALGDPHHGSALFSLPREVRDEIYRLVVRSFFFIHVVHEDKIDPTQITAAETKYGISRECHYGMPKECDFALVKVSKAIRHEASEIWFSESLFVFTMNTEPNRPITLSHTFTNGMKNVVLWFPPSSEDYGLGVVDYDRKLTIFKTAIDPFTGSHILRNSLQVNFIWLGPDRMIDSVWGSIFNIFKAVTGFATVSFTYEDFPFPSGGLSGRKSNSHVRRQISQVGRNVLEPTLGPGIEGHVNVRECLTFHPRKHQINSTGK